MKKKLKKPRKTKSAAQETDLVEEYNDQDDAGDKPKGRPLMVDYEEFVRTWSSAKTVSEAAAAMGIKRNSASAIAARLRKEGVVALRKFPRRGSQPIDVKRLNKIAAGKTAD